MAMIFETRNKNLITFILGVLATITPFAIDLYLPSFTHIAEDLGTSTSRVSLSVSSYFAGMAIGQLIHGPLLDHFGRKRPLIAGLLFYMVASIACSFSEDVYTLIGFRFMQAVGGSVSGVAALAMIKDFFSPKEGPKVLAMLILTISLSPLIAPTIGGLIAATFGWKAVFVLLYMIALFVITIVFLFLPEGRDPDKTVTLEFKPVTKTYFSILSNVQFFTYNVAGAFSFATLFIYIASSPIIFLELLEVSPEWYGIIFAFLSCGFIGASQLNVFFLKKYSCRTILRVALFMQVITGLVFLIVVLLGLMNLYSTIAMFFIFLVCVGFINPNSTALSLAPFTKNIGSAAAMLGFTKIGIAAIASIAVGLIESVNMFSMIASMLVTALFALLLLLRGEKKMSGEIIVVDASQESVVH